eukprot:TRINITY_DN12112_c3_g1_i1.p1 TRINITY_DN12112_c3_g1~~TRINITY_DN12112_c3_g1_i1.p1  ORF type:complete len:1106 (+),score=434.00 TRINITY_DN12112_c3_g1_i1:79-3396(+)
MSASPGQSPDALARYTEQLQRRQEQMALAPGAAPPELHAPAHPLLAAAAAPHVPGGTAEGPGGAERLRLQLQKRLQLEQQRNLSIKHTLGLAEQRFRAQSERQRREELAARCQELEERDAAQLTEISTLKEGQEYLLRQYEQLEREYQRRVQQIANAEDHANREEAKNAELSARLEMLQDQLSRETRDMEEKRRQLQQELEQRREEEARAARRREQQLHDEYLARDADYRRELRIREDAAKSELAEHRRVLEDKVMELEEAVQEKELTLQKMEGQIEFARNSLEAAVVTNARLEERGTELGRELAREREHAKQLAVEVARLEDAVERGAALYVDACSQMEGLARGTGSSLPQPPAAAQRDRDTHERELEAMRQLLEAKDESLAQALGESNLLRERVKVFEEQARELIALAAATPPPQPQQQQQLAATPPPTVAAPSGHPSHSAPAAAGWQDTPQQQHSAVAAFLSPAQPAAGATGTAPPPAFAAPAAFSVGSAAVAQLAPPFHPPTASPPPGGGAPAQHHQVFAAPVFAAGALPSTPPPAAAARYGGTPQPSGGLPFAPTPAAPEAGLAAPLGAGGSPTRPLLLPPGPGGRSPSPPVEPLAVRMQRAIEELQQLTGGGGGGGEQQREQQQQPAPPQPSAAEQAAAGALGQVSLVDTVVAGRCVGDGALAGRAYAADCVLRVHPGEDGSRAPAVHRGALQCVQWAHAMAERTRDQAVEVAVAEMDPPDAADPGTFLFVWSCPDAGIERVAETLLLDAEGRVARHSVTISDSGAPPPAADAAPSPPAVTDTPAGAAAGAGPAALQRQQSRAAQEQLAAPQPPPSPVASGASLSPRSAAGALQAGLAQELARLRRQVVSPENIAVQEELRALRRRAVEATHLEDRLRGCEMELRASHQERHSLAAELAKAQLRDGESAFWEEKVRGLVAENEGLKADVQRARERLVAHHARIGGDPSSPEALEELAASVGDLAASAAAIDDLRRERDRLRGEVTRAQQRTQQVLTECARLRDGAEGSEGRLGELQRLAALAQREAEARIAECAEHAQAEVARRQEAEQEVHDLKGRLAAESARREQAEVELRGARAREQEAVEAARALEARLSAFVAA